MRWVFVLIALIILAACTPPPITLVPVDTLVARTMAAMPKTNTPVSTATLAPTPTIFITNTPSLGFDPSVPWLACIPLNTERLRGLVTRVIDARTIEVAVENTSYLVRYIGIDVPGVASKLDLQGAQAIAANERFVGGKVVILVKDKSQIDADGKYLRYVIESNAFINLELVRQGYAQAASMPPDTACDAMFLVAQSEAQTARIGIWIPTLLPTPTVTKTPTITPLPTKTVKPACNCYGPPLSCKNFRTQADAQACFVWCKSLGLDDIFGLDKNRNGKACDGLP
jgi:endonuclease YncB( thermonuclease family)